MDHISNAHEQVLLALDQQDRRDLENVRCILDRQFPVCLVHLDRFPARKEARCPSLCGHHVCHDCIRVSKVFRQKPFETVHPDCGDDLWTYENLPGDLPALADRIRRTPIQWRQQHPCHGQNKCEFFYTSDGTCVDPDCTNYFCFTCNTHNHLAGALCTGHQDINQDNDKPRDQLIDFQAPIPAPPAPPSPPTPVTNPVPTPLIGNPTRDNAIRSCRHYWRRNRGMGRGATAGFAKSLSLLYVLGDFRDTSNTMLANFHLAF
ncbi:hypothetical protein F5X99DRAFT_405920 [Biscogniauxia marginata]|nr:hypothetical protein F5X99DRAFT_405920 [Biscogniauxia marginata]